MLKIVLPFIAHENLTCCGCYSFFGNIMKLLACAI